MILLCYCKQEHLNVNIILSLLKLFPFCIYSIQYFICTFSFGGLQHNDIIATKSSIGTFTNCNVFLLQWQSGNREESCGSCGQRRRGGCMSDLRWETGGEVSMKARRVRTMLVVLPCPLITLLHGLNTFGSEVELCHYISFHCVLCVIMLCCTLGV